ncbi:MAG: RDD family protein [Bacteroidetes bacterium]|nr:MAG: RDD family protein [Bacteroidota bacterium]
MQKSIEITTTQNVTIEYDLARLRERGLAWLLDLVIVLLGYFILRNLLRTIFRDVPVGDSGWAIFGILLPVLGYFLYNIFFEIWNIGQTPGKMAMGIKVVRLDGKDPEWSDVVLRAVLHLVDSLFSFSVIGAVLIKTTDKSQRLGDMAANTTVIKIQSSRFQFRLQDILSISTLENYQPVYPQVRNLSERDMIFIKMVLTRVQRYPNQAHEEVVEDLVSHLMPILDIEKRPLNRVDFLKTLLRDYIVLTR